MDDSFPPDDVQTDGSPAAMPRTVAVLFSGGDAPGMNPLLRFLVRLGLNRYGATVLGVKDGYTGLVRTARRVATRETSIEALRESIQQHIGSDGLFRRGLDIVRMDHVSVSGLGSRGGIVLGADRCPQFLDADVRRQVAELLRGLSVDALIAVGGDGTLDGAQTLAAESGLTVVGVPATIDDDVEGTEVTLGFDTAVNTIMRAIEQINDTAGSHHRVIIVETMGRACGNLARTAAVAGGVEIVVTPERGTLTLEKMQAIAERLEETFQQGQTHAVVLIAEGVRTDDSAPIGPAAAFRRFLDDFLRRAACPVPGIGVRDSVLGHLQRGGSPTAADRILAARFAEAAWDAIVRAPPQDGVIGLASGRIACRPFGARGEPNDSVQRSLYGLQKAVTKW